MNRRQLILTTALNALDQSVFAARWPAVVPGTVLRFPQDHGAHPDFRTEWWYLTGWLRDSADRDLGVQVTFFRNRPGVQEQSSSRFAPVQLLFGHAAIADASVGQLRHDQRSARAGFDLATAASATTGVRVDDWEIKLSGNTYRVSVEARDFSIALECVATSPPVLHGDHGFSRKGPKPRQASWYYSRPHLGVTGTLRFSGGRNIPVRGSAWLDHEWSTELLDNQATGWDWCGINLHDGGSLMAFRVRDDEGKATWSGGSRQSGSNDVRLLRRGEIGFAPIRHWTSPRTGVRYPVAMTVSAGTERFTLEPLFDDQELDARTSTGTLYWEGAVRAISDEREVGRGYLELTGYDRRIRL